MELLDTVGHRGSVVSEVQDDAFVRDGRRELLLRPFSSDVWTQRVEALNQSEGALPFQLHGDSEAQVAASALSRDNDARRIDVEIRCVCVYPFEARNAIIQTGGKGSDFRHGRRVNGVAKLNHSNRYALRCDHAAPGLVVAVKTGVHLHTPTVDVVHTRQSVVLI